MRDSALQTAARLRAVLEAVWPFPTSGTSSAVKLPLGPRERLVQPMSPQHVDRALGGDGGDTAPSCIPVDGAGWDWCCWDGSPCMLLGPSA